MLVLHERIPWVKLQGVGKLLAKALSQKSGKGKGWIFCKEFDDLMLQLSRPLIRFPRTFAVWQLGPLQVGRGLRKVAGKPPLCEWKSQAM